MRFALGLILTLFAISLKSSVIEVCKTCAINSIKEGISLAKKGDRIIVGAGVYRESSILVNKSIRLSGKDFPVVDGQHRKEEIFIIDADSVILEGFQIQNIDRSYLNDLSGIRVKRREHFVIRNNRLYHTMFGIYLEYSNRGLIEKNFIRGDAIEESSSGNGIHAWNCKYLRILDNSVVKHRDGIYFEFVSESQISRNICRDNLRYGLHFMFSNFDEYRDNLFSRNGAGVAVMFSKQIKMYDNRFIENWGGAAYGLLLKEIYDADIGKNIFEKNTVAIRVEGSSRIRYFLNDFVNNGWAIRVSGGCYDNHIRENNFVSNSFDLAMDKLSNNNSIERNYWSDYSGYDLDHDGLGDVAHRPVKLFNYIVLKTPESLVLLRSLFIDLINFSERVSPIFTPENVTDEEPLMQPVKHKS